MARSRTWPRSVSRVANPSIGKPNVWWRTWKAQSRIAELEQQHAAQQARLAEQEQRLQRAVEISQDKQAEFASTAQAEGVSLPVARRLFAVLAGKRTPSVAALERQTAAAAQQATALLSVLDAAARARLTHAAADDIFLADDQCS